MCNFLFGVILELFCKEVVLYNKWVRVVYVIVCVKLYVEVFLIWVGLLDFCCDLVVINVNVVFIVLKNFECDRIVVKLVIWNVFF